MRYWEQPAHCLGPAAYPKGLNRLWATVMTTRVGVGGGGRTRDGMSVRAQTRGGLPGEGNRGSQGPVALLLLY